MTPEDRLQELEAESGHPGDLWSELQAVVQSDALMRFTDVENQWLKLMWSLDRHRIAGLPPRNMGNLNLDDARRLGGVYRDKGNWFATLIALLLQNRTEQHIRPRTRVRGFSQYHQVDIAWPVREEDPLICAETKVTGAPAFGRTPARGALNDWSNRRKELKFAATDLKLYRRQQATSIQHWGVWRESAPPKTYFLWAARLREGESVQRLAIEAQALVNTYLDGAGLVAWRERRDGEGYEMVAHPVGPQVTTLDDVLYRIESEIRRTVREGGQAPPPQRPAVSDVDVGQLADDATDYDGAG